MTTHGVSFRPERAVDGPVVTIPTLMVGRMKEDEEPSVLLRWYGWNPMGLDYLGEDKAEAEAAFNESQFHFPVSSDVNATHWMGHPELFRVVSIGQVKDWPNMSIRQHFTNPEDWILYIASTHYTMPHPSGRDVPNCLLVPLRVFLAEQMYGVIMPKKYQGPPAV